MAAKSRHFLGDVRALRDAHDLLRGRRGIAGHERETAPSPAAQAGPRDRSRPRAAAAASDSISPPSASLRAVSRPPDAHPSRARIVSSWSIASSERALQCLAKRLAQRLPVDGSLANDERLRQAEQVAGCQLALDQPSLARDVDGRRPSRGRTPPAARPAARDPDAACSDTDSSTRPRDSRFCNSARSRGSRSARYDGSAQLQIEEPVIDGAKRQPDRAALVLARERRKPGHALDHQPLTCTAPAVRRGFDSISCIACSRA